MRQRWLASAVLAAAAAGSLGVPRSLVVVLTLLPVVALLVGARWKLRTAMGNAGSFVVGFLALIATRAVDPSELQHDVTLLSERELLFLLPLIQVAAFRSLLARPSGGHGLTAALVVLALTAGGGARSGGLFAPLAALACCAALRGISCSDPDRASHLALTGKRAFAVVVAVLLTVASVSGAAAVGPAIHSLLIERMQKRFSQSRVGFSDRMELGDFTRLLQDSRVVLRLRGESPHELLRGAVFSEYTTGTWRPFVGSAVRTAPSLDLEPPTGPGWLEVEHARRPERYFLPSSATDVRASSGGYLRDGYGVLYPPQKAYAKRVWFQQGEGLSRQPPRNLEVRMPTRTKKQMRHIAESWGVQHGSPLERMEAIQSHLLQHYTYSLHSEHGTLDDPILDFLLEHPQGHCEFFASAMALLGRSVGVPTRLVSGYRVAETSRFGYHIVRRRHAHTWVSAWIDGAWRTFDPTPAAELAASMPVETPLLSALGDGLKTLWEQADDWLERRTTFELVMALAVLGGLLLLSRSLRARKPNRQGSAVGDEGLPGFLALDAALRRLGLGRQGWESPGALALRVEHSEAMSEEQSRLVASVLRSYSAHAYGGLGDAADVEQQLREGCRALTAKRKTGPQ